MQADADAFRVRKETLKAAYTSAEAQRDLAGVLAPAGGPDAGELSASQAAARWPMSRRGWTGS
jgi:hypothetical protein